MNKYLSSLEKFGINLGLDRINSLLAELGNPHLKFKSIHVAGTNGKGSTCAMIASILKEGGYKVGLYTSPHLFDYRERIQINGKIISQRDFERGLGLTKRIEPENEFSVLSGSKARINSRFAGLEPRIYSQVPGKLTVFEALTAVAFWYFAKEKVDYAVIEVGMGGRLDATNVIMPLVSVITSIDLEHTAFLGRTLAKVAAEKAAIIKRGVPVITAETKPEALKVIKHNADKNRSLLIQVSSKGEGLKTNLLGEHQKTNAACAVAAVRLAGIEVGKQAVLKGLRKVNWPGRFQIISKKPLTIVDGAHNPAGIKVLVATLRERFPGRKLTFIIGAQQDKNLSSMLKLIRPAAKQIILTHSSHRNAANKNSIPLKQALKQTKRENRIIAGSLFLAADALKCLDAVYRS